MEQENTPKSLMNNLPVEIIGNITSHLDANDIANFMRTNRYLANHQLVYPANLFHLNQSAYLA